MANEWLGITIQWVIVLSNSGESLLMMGIEIQPAVSDNKRPSTGKC